MEEPRIIFSDVINVTRYLFFLLGYIALSTSLVFVISLALDGPSFVPFIGIAIAWLAPLLFEKRARKMFSRTSVVSLFKDHLSIELEDRKTGSKEIKEFRYDEMSSYKVMDSTKDDSTFLKLVLKDGSNAKYTFLGQKEGDDEHSILVNLHRFIKAYNETCTEDGKITFAPSFFASRLGTYLFGGLTLFLISTLIAELIYKPKAIPLTLGSGASLYLTMLMQWKKDTDQYKEMK